MIKISHDRYFILNEIYVWSPNSNQGSWLKFMCYYDFMTLIIEQSIRYLLYVTLLYTLLSDLYTQCLKQRQMAFFDTSVDLNFIQK